MRCLLMETAILQSMPTFYIKLKSMCAILNTANRLIKWRTVYGQWRQRKGKDTNSIWLCLCYTPGRCFEVFNVSILRLRAFYLIKGLWAFTLDLFIPNMSCFVSGFPSSYMSCVMWVGSGTKQLNRDTFTGNVFYTF